MSKNLANKTIIKTYSGINFIGLNGFGCLVDTATTFYALDWTGNKIIIYDSNWQYLTYKNFSSPINMITVNNSLYISGDNFIYKTDKNLNITKQYYSASAGYRGLFFNSSGNTIYVAGFSKKAIDILDLNLIFVDSISTSTYSPCSVQRYKNYVYAGTGSSQLLVIENKVIIQTVVACASLALTSILIDHFGYITFSCLMKTQNYLYHTENISYTGMNLTYTLNPIF